MKLLPMIVALVLVGSGIPATWAEVLPPKGNTDGRVRVVDYDPMNVIRLVTQFGVSTHVEFPEEELVQDVAVGDEQACLLYTSDAADE